MKSKKEITPLKKPVKASICIPGSKSYTNRALVLAALTKGRVCLSHPLYSDDTEAMIGCLRALGLKIETNPGQILVHNDISCIEDRYHSLFAHDSGTTARFMLALLCIVPGIKILQGSSRLQERPIKDLVDALRELGADISYCDREGQLPVKVFSSSLCGDSVVLQGDTSSQFCSALLLISPYLSKGLSIHLATPLISKPYIDMTLSSMRDWGVDVIKGENGSYFIPANQCYQKAKYAIEGDFSSAGYFFALAALTKSTITVENINPISAQADRKFLDILSKMGNMISYQENSVSVEGKGVIPLAIDMEDCPDQVMTMAVLAAFAKGTTTISGVRSLRVKETERVLALGKELAKMTIQTQDTHDTLTIYGSSPQGAEIDTYNDHRIAMAFAIAGTHLPGITICHPEVVSKTFPTFWDVLGSMQQ